MDDKYNKYNMTDCFHQGRAWIELSRTALRENIRQLQQLLPSGCRLMPAVKANAYGHGAVLIAHECQKAGIQDFCVATVFEGIELREAGIQGQILILGYTHPGLISLLCRYHLTQTVFDLQYAMELNSYQQKIAVHVKIDTGMHRLGERWDAPEKIARIFSDCDYLEITGVLTHICTKNLASVQIQRFYQTLSILKKRGCKIPAIHYLSSAEILNPVNSVQTQTAGDYARVGIALYGLLSSQKEQENCPILSQLQPVLSLKARVAQVRELQPGEHAGYDLQFTAGYSDRNKLAVLTIGYADGLPWSLSCGVGHVLIHGQKVPIAGRICMDQTLIDITGVPDVSTGDIAILIGKSGTQEITACEIAGQAGTISNEVLSRLGGRLERILIE